MKILHVSQGMPPFRVGGLTRYCFDLMQEQVKQGHSVSILYPGSYSIGKTRIKKLVCNSKITQYEILNPLPMALVFGINEPDRYVKKCGSNCYRLFLEKENFDVIHVHCIMGIHREFFEEAKRQRIRMISTTHDFYVFCPICTLLKNNMTLCDEISAYDCRQCNIGKGLSKKQEILMQSNIYKKLKYTVCMSKIRHTVRQKLGKREKRDCVQAASVESYGKLLKYNRDILHLMDIIHCNSTLTKEIYQKHEPDLCYKTISITHSNMPSKVNRISGSPFSIAYLGGGGENKGYAELLLAMKKLDILGFKKWHLYLYGDDYCSFEKDEPRIYVKGRYDGNNLTILFQNIDLVIMYSKCYETFGFVAQEALAAGIPVIVSDRVGAKELLKNAPVQLCVSAMNPDELANKIVEVFDKREMVKKWAMSVQIDDISTHSKKIERIYRG